MDIRLASKKFWKSQRLWPGSWAQLCWDGAPAFALLRERDCITNRILSEMGVDYQKIQQGILNLSEQGAGGAAGNASGAENAGDTPSLDKFGRDLTAAAKMEETRPGDWQKAGD